MSSMPEFSLIVRVRRGEINFERLVEVLSSRGYITDTDGEEGIGFGRVSMDQTNQDDFDALFKVLMPGVFNDIKLRQSASAEGGTPGAFTNALFNENVIEREGMDPILVRINQAVAKEYS